MNKPYVKVLDEKRQISNPILKNKPYLNTSPSRQQRRSKQPKFMGNGNNFSLTVIGSSRFLRMQQLIVQKNGSLKSVFHYILRHNK